MIGDMNIRVKDYLENLSKVDMPRENGVIVLDEPLIKQNIQGGILLRGKTHCQIGDKRYYYKASSNYYPNNICANTEVINSEVYNDLGINCADYYPAIIRCDSLLKTTQNKFGVISQDLNGLEDIEVCQPYQTSMYKTFVSSEYNAVINNDYWALLKIKDLIVGKEITEECFNDIVNLFLLDVVTTQRDRSYSNYFLYRKKGDTLWQGVIAIDNSYTLQNLQYAMDYDFNNMNIKDLASSLWNNGYQVQTFQNMGHIQPYKHRLKEINKLIQDGAFTDKQIELIKNIQDYDLSATIDSVEKDKHLKVLTSQKDLMKYMWEKVQNTLEV